MLLVVAAIWFALFVWPGPLLTIVEERSKVENETEIDARLDTRGGQEMDRAQQARDDMKKMNEAAKEASKH